MTRPTRGGGRVRVLFCESNKDGTIGGSHYCLLYLIEHLDRTAFEPIAIFYEHHALIDRFKAVAETIVVEPRPAAQWGRARRGSMAALPVVMARRAVNLWRFLRTVADNVSFLRRRGIDIVELNNSITRHHDWMWAALIAGVPCVTHERGTNPRYSWLDRFLSRRLELVIPVSQWIRDHMLARGVAPDNVRVMYDGLDPDGRKPARTAAALRAAWRIAPARPIVGIVGNIREWKGQEIVVRALIEVVKVRPDVVCLFVGAVTAGDKAYEARLLRLIADAGIEDNVRFTGFQRDVASVVDMMAFVIHASIEPEPFGMVVLEAMAHRKAVIGSRAGGVIEMVVEGDTGYTFPPGDWHALGQRMIELLDHPEVAARMGAAGYARLVGSFTVAQFMDQINRMYRAILEGRPVAAALAAPVAADAARGPAEV